jgi:hypothetical protein
MLVHEPNVREGAGNTPATCGCQAEARVKFATAREIIHLTGKSPPVGQIRVQPRLKKYFA